MVASESLKGTKLSVLPHAVDRRLLVAVWAPTLQRIFPQILAAHDVCGVYVSSLPLFFKECSILHSLS